jgi:hypothetical protein
MGKPAWESPENWWRLGMTAPLFLCAKGVDANDTFAEDFEVRVCPRGIAYTITAAMEPLMLSELRSRRRPSGDR